MSRSCAYCECGFSADDIRLPFPSAVGGAIAFRVHPKCWARAFKGVGVAIESALDLGSIDIPLRARAAALDDVLRILDNEREVLDAKDEQLVSDLEAQDKKRKRDVRLPKIQGGQPAKNAKKFIDSSAEEDSNEEDPDADEVDPEEIEFLNENAASLKGSGVRGGTAVERELAAASAWLPAELTPKKTSARTVFQQLTMAAALQKR